MWKWLCFFVVFLGRGPIIRFWGTLYTPVTHQHTKPPTYQPTNPPTYRYDAGDWDHNKGVVLFSPEVVLVPFWGVMGKKYKNGFIPFLAKVFSWEPALWSFCSQAWVNQSYERLDISHNTTILTHVKISHLPKFEVCSSKNMRDVGFLVKASKTIKFHENEKIHMKIAFFGPKS